MAVEISAAGERMARVVIADVGKPVQDRLMRLNK
jgi:hypothetical protein